MPVVLRDFAVHTNRFSNSPPVTLNFIPSTNDSPIHSKITG